MNNLKEKRKAVGVSQAKLAELAKCARSYVAEVELGHQPLTLKMAKRFAPHLYCTPFELMGSDAIKYQGEVGDFDEIVSSLVLQFWDPMIQANQSLPREKNARFMIAYHLFCVEGWDASQLDAILNLIVAMEDKK